MVKIKGERTRIRKERRGGVSEETIASPERRERQAQVVPVRDGDCHSHRDLIFFL